MLHYTEQRMLIKVQRSYIFHHCKQFTCCTNHFHTPPHNVFNLIAFTVHQCTILTRKKKCNIRPVFGYKEEENEEKNINKNNEI